MADTQRRLKSEKVPLSYIILLLVIDTGLQHRIVSRRGVYLCHELFLF